MHASVLKDAVMEGKNESSKASSLCMRMYVTLCLERRARRGGGMAVQAGVCVPSRFKVAGAGMRHKAIQVGCCPSPVLSVSCFERSVCMRMPLGSGHRRQGS